MRRQRWGLNWGTLATRAGDSTQTGQRVVADFPPSCLVFFRGEHVDSIDPAEALLDMGDAASITDAAVAARI